MNELKPWERLPGWMKSNRFFKKDLVNGGPMQEVNPEHANLVSSKLYDSLDEVYHYPVIDLDMEAALIPSSTQGHSHLYINKVLTSAEYEKLLTTLVEVGIVQQGILDLQWNQDGMTCARLPGIQKEKNSLNSAGIPIAKMKKPMKFVNGGTIQVSPAYLANTKSLPLSTIPTPNPLAEPVSEDKDVNNAIIMFNNLVKQASTTGGALNDLIDAWHKFAGIAKPESPF